MGYFRSLKQKLESLSFGRSSERMAEKFLRKNGYSVIESNYRCRGGEIDIVAREKDYLVFCEVKARRTKNYGTPLEGVTPAKIHKIRKAAEHYLMKKKLTGRDVRFDVVTVDESDGSPKLELIRNAF